MSVELSKSDEGAIRLAVTAAPAGVSTRAPLPATALMLVNDSGGAGLITLRVRSPAWILVLAGISFLATPTLVPLWDGNRKEKLAPPGGGGKGAPARMVPPMM